MATPADTGQINDLQSRSGELNSSYQQALSDLVAADSKVSIYDAQIKDASSRRDQVQAQIQDGQNQLKQLEDQLSTREGALQKRLLSTYKSGNTGYLDVVLGAGDFDDFLNRVDMVSLIAEDDRHLIEGIKNNKKSVEDQLNALSQKQDELHSLIGGLTSAQNSMIDARAKQQQEVASLKQQMQDNQNQLAQLQSQAAAIETKMSQIQSGAQSSGGDGGSGGAPPAGGASFSMTATAYCLAGSTATGMPTGFGVIAVDPSVIPLGSRVHVSGYGDAIAADTGGAIRGNRIDVWLPCGQADAWGSRAVSVTVY